MPPEQYFAISRYISVCAAGSDIRALASISALQTASVKRQQNVFVLSLAMSVVSIFRSSYMTDKMLCITLFIYC